MIWGEDGGHVGVAGGHCIVDEGSLGDDERSRGLATSCVVLYGDLLMDMGFGGPEAREGSHRDPVLESHGADLDGTEQCFGDHD